MRHKLFIGAILFVLIFSVSLYAQEKVMKIEMPARTMNQKLDRAVLILDGTWCHGIAYAKSMGETVEEFGRFTGKLWAPGWESGKGRGVRYFVNYMYINMAMYADFKMEILSESDTSVKYRHTRCWKRHFSDGDLFGVSLEEFELFWKETILPITDLLGFKYEQEADGEWLVITVSEKE